jgi:hypothetical protein
MAADEHPDDAWDYVTLTHPRNERTVMPYVASMFHDEEPGVIEWIDPSSPVIRSRHERAHLRGELAVFDDPLLPLGLQVDGEYDVVWVGVPGSFSVLLAERGKKVVGGVEAGTYLSIERGQYCIGTVEGIAAGGGTQRLYDPGLTRIDDANDIITSSTGIGDAPVGIALLLDEDHEVVGIGVGLFEERAWESRIMPGDGRISARRLVQDLLLQGDPAAPVTGLPDAPEPVAVYDEDDQFLGWVSTAQWDGEHPSIYVQKGFGDTPSN